MQAHTVLLPATEVMCTITIHPEVDDSNQCIDEYITQPFMLDALTFDSDVTVRPAEFYYLFDLAVHQVVEVIQLKQAVKNLIKKNKFSKIILHFKSTPSGVVLHVSLEGYWSFERLSLRGAMIGKDRFGRHYTMQSGDRFDEAAHTESLQEIIKAFKKEGYLKASVEDNVIRNSTTKTVVVQLTLHRGPRFFIDDISVSYAKSAQQELSIDEQLLSNKVKVFLRKRLKGTAYTDHTISKELDGLKKYLATKGFMHVGVEVNEELDVKNNRVAIQFTLILRHKRAFIFWGNRFFSTKELLDAIFVFGDIAWSLPSTILAEEIANLYRKKGFWHVMIEARDEEEKSFFIIKEGGRVTVDEVQLHTVSQEHSKVKSIFNTLLKMKFYDVQVQNEACESLCEWYASKGFCEAKILKKEHVKIDDTDHYTLHIYIEEGAQTVLSGFSIPQFPHLEKEGPFRAIHNKEGSIAFTYKLLDEQRKWLSSHFQKKGYAHVDIQYEIKKNGDAAQLIWHIAPGPIVRFGKTIVLGSLDIPFEAVMHELQYKEGEVWNKKKLQDSLLSFKKLEIFDGVNMYPDPESMDRNTGVKPVVLKLVKDDPFELKLRAGFGIQQIDRHFSTAGLTYKLGGTFIAKNPLNYADLLKVEADASRSWRSAMIGYQVPGIGSLSLPTIFKGYSSKYLYPGCIGTSRNLYQIKQEGFLIGIKKIVRWFDFGFNVGIESMRTSLSDKRSETKRMAARVARAINFDPFLLNKHIPYVMCEPALFINCLDNPLNPTKGSLTVVAGKGMIPFGTYRRNAFFARLDVEQSFFIPVCPLVFVLHMRFGHIFLQNFKHIMPNERFYLGGANSIRSYVTDRCPPLGVVVDECGKEHTVPQGGKSLCVLNAEIRFPIYKAVGGALFQDIGFLSDTRFSDVPREKILTGTGFGLFYITPVGPLRFDFAWKWHNDVPQSRPYAWYVSFGQPF